MELSTTVFQISDTDFSIALHRVATLCLGIRYDTKVDDIFHFLQNALDEATEPWGIKVERVEM